jgi:hypothetical protein
MPAFSAAVVVESLFGLLEFSGPQIVVLGLSLSASRREILTRVKR